MFKRMALVCLVCVLIALPAFAQEMEGFGGNINWPSIRGINLGTDENYVLLYEERYNGMTVEAGSGNSLNRDYYSIGETEVYGETCAVTYGFKDGVFVEAECLAVFATKEEALAYCEKVTAEFIELYGEGAVSTEMEQLMEDVDSDGSTQSETPESEYKTLYAHYWQTRSSQLPGMIEDEDGSLDFPEEYFWAGESIICEELEDGTYAVAMNARMPYFAENE